MTFTKDQLKTLARGVANGVATLRLAGEIGVDRIVLRRMLDSGQLLRNMAQALNNPDELGAVEIEHLLTAGALPGERSDNLPIRRAFADEVRKAHPDWIKERAERKADEEKRRRLEQRHEERLAAKREARAAKMEALRAECRRADFWNLKSLCEIQRREWATGTPDERKRGIIGADKLEKRRRRYGIKWGCAGFGVYYAERWSAARCTMWYAAQGNFLAVVNDPAFAGAWSEIEAEQAEKVMQAYDVNPLHRRDPQLPTTEAAAKAFFERLGAGDK